MSAQSCGNHRKSCLCLSSITAELLLIAHCSLLKQSDGICLPEDRCQTEGARLIAAKEMTLGTVNVGTQGQL